MFAVAYVYIINGHMFLIYLPPKNFTKCSVFGHVMDEASLLTTNTETPMGRMIRDNTNLVKLTSLGSIFAMVN